MVHSSRALAPVVLFAAVFAMACLPGGGAGDPTPTPTPQAGVLSARTAVPSASLTPSPTVLPVLPVLATYTVKSGDYPTLIAETAGVPAAEQEEWIAEMLALNGVEATSLQIGQTLILPPSGNGALPSVRSDNPLADNTQADTTPEPAPPAGAIEPAGPGDDVAPDVTSTPKPGTTPFAGGGVPFAPTPPFVAFTTPSPSSFRSSSLMVIA